MALLSASNGVVAWINFNGTGSISTRDSYNVNSITDQGNGKYQVNFQTSANNGDYTVASGSCHANEDNVNPTFCHVYNADNELTTGKVRVKTGYHQHGTANIGHADRSYVFVAIIGDSQ
tara:strand:- start:193 stop:549 length:357 start_codon:yes stop_codon:yes gene_type:complete